MAPSKPAPKKLSDYRFHAKTQFRIEAPTGRSKSFRIRYKEPDKTWSPVSLPEIDAANKLFREGVTDLAATKQSLQHVLACLYQQRDKFAPKIEMLSKNERLAKLVYEEKYPPSRTKRMEDPDGPMNEMIRVVKACGTRFPLATCDLEELDDHFHELFEENTNKLYRTITWTNAILRHLGRKQLQQIDPEKPDVKYLTEPDFVTKVLPACTDQMDRLLYSIAFYTGMRKAEIFYLEPHHLKEHTVWVEGQMTYGGKLKKRLKRNKPAHDAILPADVRADIEQWCDIPMDARRKVRKRKHAARLRAICKKIWPTNRMKHLRVHDLRHSNAIWLLENTAMQLYQIAQHLGNSAAVVEKYYSGYQLKKGTIDTVAKLLDSRKKGW